MQKVKVGDTVEILEVDEITRMFQPELIGTKQVIVGFINLGSPTFANDTPNAEDSMWERQDANFMFINESDGWRFKVVE